MTTMEPTKESMEALEKTFTGTWQTKLVRFLPCGPFWKAIACPCVLYGFTAQRLRDPTVAAEKDNDDCMDFARDNVLMSTCFLQIMEHRAQIRRRYGIKGSTTNDCLVSCFCCACAVMQHEDELKARLAAEGVVVHEGYRSQQPMAMQMPAEQAQGQYPAQGRPQGQGQHQPQSQQQGQHQAQGQFQAQGHHQLQQGYPQPQGYHHQPQGYHHQPQGHHHQLQGQYQGEGPYAAQGQHQGQSPYQAPGPYAAQGQHQGQHQGQGPYQGHPQHQEHDQGQGQGPEKKEKKESKRSRLLDALGEL